MARNKVDQQKQYLARRLVISAVMVASLTVLTSCTNGPGTKNTVLLDHMGGSTLSPHQHMQHQHM